MRSNRLALLLGAVLSCMAVSGCVSIPTADEVEEKNSIIKNLSGQIDVLNEEMSKLRLENEDLRSDKSQLEERVLSLENQKAGAGASKTRTQPPEENIK